jgi:tRNA modification GTPase
MVLGLSVTRESDRNFAAVLTPPGVGAIAVIRLHGTGVAGFLDACFSRPAIADRCVHGELFDAGKVIDDPVAVLSRGRQAVDLNLHGGPWVVQACLNLARRHGFSIVDPCQFPLPPFMLDGDGDALDHEILAHLPLAKTEMAVRVLLLQKRAWQRLKIAPPSPVEAAKILADRSLHWLLHPPRVAIVGVPNAGKSTLANQLFGQRRSIVADLPGTTRDWVGETANLDGLAVTLIDTPGIRISLDAIESQAIERATDQFNRADAIVLVLDATRVGDPLQQAIVDRFPEAIRVLNKADAAPLAIDPAAICTTATTGGGIDALRRSIRGRFSCDPMDMTAPRCWTERQRQIIRGASINGP